jgi:NAD(P)H-nitrite reductase large subunit
MGAPQINISCNRRCRAASPNGTIGTWKAEHARENKQAKAGGDRQRNGRHSHGRSAAGPRADLYDITVFGSEPYGNYNRILLSPVLAGEKTVNDIMLNTEQWYEDNGITLRKGEMIEMIDRRTCEVVTAAGERVPYDRLLIATGSNPIMLPLAGQGPSRRDRLSATSTTSSAWSKASTSHRNAVVIGGGLLGLEAANG